MAQDEIRKIDSLLLEFNYDRWRVEEEPKGQFYYTNGPSGNTSKMIVVDKENPKIEDVVNSLVILGIQQEEIEKALNKIE